jgi:hypothetical protein
MNLVRTHVPLDENDDPEEEVIAALHPDVILNAIPELLGFSLDMEREMRDIDSSRQKAEEASKEFKFSRSLSRISNPRHLNFSQFHLCLYEIAKIVYPGLNETIALHKVMQESVLPLYVWSQDHFKAGSQDPLLRDPRISLLLMTYAPNLWRVFLHYAQVNRSPQAAPESLSYPEGTKFVERELFGVPSGAPWRKQDAQEAIASIVCMSEVPGYFIDDANGSSEAKSVATASKACEFDSFGNKCSLIAGGLVISEAMIVRFCIDYGIIPHLIGKVEVRAIWRAVNRDKLGAPASVGKYADDDQSAADAFSTCSVNILHAAKGSAQRGITFGSPSFQDFPHQRTPVSVLTKAYKTPVSCHSGIAFTEWLEFLGRVALEGLVRSQYTNMFNGDFSKVLALLTVHGVADLIKLQEVKTMRMERCAIQL